MSGTALPVAVTEIRLASFIRKFLLSVGLGDARRRGLMNSSKESEDALFLGTI
jgi:hypothetical protein